MISPSGFAVSNEYNERGYNVSVTDTQSGNVLHQNSADAFGVTLQSFGNGITTTTQTFDERSGRLLSIDTTSDGSQVQQLEYQWRSDLALESRTSTASGVERKEVFSYDPLQRLTQARTFLAGSAQRTLAYSYDKLGNILDKTSDVASDNQVTGYAYGSTNNAGPHAVTNAVINGIDYTLNYDQNGAATHYDAETGSDKFISYNANNQPVVITVGSTIDDPNPVGQDSFSYGPDGHRYYKKSIYLDSNDARQVEHTFYVGQFQLTVLATGRVEKTYVGNNILHIQNTPLLGTQTTTVEYLHRDYTGSVDKITDARGDVLQPMAFDPYGTRRNSDWASAITSVEFQALLAIAATKTSRGFTGHEHLDRTGFIHMNGRVYDPTLGRFLSPDPIVLNPTSSQSWNRYSYVLNNPMSFSDPTGFAPDIKCSDGCYPNAPPPPPPPAPERSQGPLEDLLVTGYGYNRNNFNENVLLLQSLALKQVPIYALFQPQGAAVGAGNNSLSGLKPGECDNKRTGGNCRALSRTDSDTDEDSKGLSYLALFVGATGEAASATGGSAGITSKGAFKWYYNAWQGNQYIATYKFVAIGKLLGGGSFFIGFLADVSALGNGGISGQKLVLNTAMGALTFTKFGFVGLSYGVAETAGPEIYGGAINKLIEIQGGP